MFKYFLKKYFAYKVQ